MNKKKYIAPRMEGDLEVDVIPLCISNRSVQTKKGTEFWENEEFDVSYGGIDHEDDGLLDPS